MEDDEEDLMKAAFSYFSLLLNGGNAVVQRCTMDAFELCKSTKSLLRIREELNRAVSTLMLHFAEGADSEFGVLQQQEHAWLISLIQGIQNMVEGAYSPLQNFLRDQTGVSSDMSVDFVAALATVLQDSHTQLWKKQPGQMTLQLTAVRKRWFELITATLETIAELCQGNQQNQVQALGKRVVSTISAIVAWDPTEYLILLEVTRVKRASLLVLESMLELSNAEARDIASSVASNLNQEELYLAMNRFYYINLFEKKMLELRPQAINDPTKSEQNANECALASRECYYIIRRMRDLTGSSTSWNLHTASTVLGSSLKGMGTQAHRKTIAQFYAKKDDIVWNNFTKKLQKQHDQDKISAITGADRTFLLYATKALAELDDHGGELLSRNYCDRVESLMATTISVEFVRQVGKSDEVQKIYFQTPKIEQRLTKAEQFKVRKFLSLDSAQDKVRTLLEMFSKKRHRLQWEAYLQSNIWLLPFSNKMTFFWLWVHFILTLAINACMLVAYKADMSKPYSTVPITKDWFEPVLIVLGTLHIIMSLMLTTTFVINKWPRGDYNEKWVQVKAKLPEFVGQGLFLAFSVLGFQDTFFFAIHLFLQVQSDPKLERAVLAVTRNGKELTSVFLFIL